MLLNRTNELPIEAWEAVYFTDGNILHYKSTDYSWADLPKDGCVLVIWWHDYYGEGLRRKTLSHGHDYNVLSDLVFGDTNNFEEVKGLDYKRGIWVNNDELWEEIYRTAFEALE